MAPMSMRKAIVLVLMVFTGQTPDRITQNSHGDQFTRGKQYNATSLNPQGFSMPSANGIPPLPELRE